jgi:hypothetical protein
LARFLQPSVMANLRIARETIAAEDKIERLARLVLVALLFATLGWIL